jgi:hypothetical protein
MKHNLTPEQRACIQEATQALSDCVISCRWRCGGYSGGHAGANPTPEEVFMIVTCNGQQMTLQRFKDALIRLNPPPPQEYTRR